MSAKKRSVIRRRVNLRGDPHRRFHPHRFRHCIVITIPANGRKRVPALWPKWVRFWITPAFRVDSRLEGLNSVDCLNRDEMIAVAVEFYRTGIRYPPFEKCILEALIYAEYFATYKMARQGQLSSTASERLIKGWAFEKTLGGDPQYSLYVAGGFLLKRLVAFAIFMAAAIWAVISYTNEPTLSNIISAAVLGLIAIAAVGRWLVRQTMRWAQPDASTAIARLVRHNPVARAITQLETLTRIVSAQTVSITLARDAARRCYSDGGVFDQIVLPYLDRAHDAGEHVWINYDGNYEYDLNRDDSDFESNEPI